ncbi:transmembrane amino acid transporter protein [Sarocladium implicatum]|nr:transmembrane amino acid transporter protein [Sarocladium implicatum]
MSDQLVGSPKENEDQDRRVAAILDRHLPEGYSAEPEVSLASEGEEAELARVDSPVPSAAGSGFPGSDYGRSGTPDNVESSLRLQGGDIHRDIFRIKARANSLRRSNTFSYNPSPRLQPDGLTYSDQLEPGGFRRHHIRQQGHHRSKSGPLVVANSFVDFLDLYGSFAGEDLDDTDSASGDDESALDDGENEQEDGERRPLIRRPTAHRRRSSRRIAREGDASTLKTFFTLIKAFIGTGIMFLPKAFLNGGILFSSMTLIVVSLVTCLCFRLLLDCRERYGGGYGELGAAIGGPRLRKMILVSIALSQLGFVCAGIIFTAENLWSFLDAVTKGRGNLSLGVPALIGLQLIPLVPLALIRNISKLGPVALIADVFILIGLVYIWYFDAHTLITRGMEPSVELFNPSAFTLTIGSAIFTFEGIGLILPIQSSMKKPEHFSKLLYLVMFIITVIFTSVGALCYATFGDKTKIQVISNFPQSSALVNAVQFLYSLAVLAGEPVQLFPAVRIIETTLFGERATGKKSAAIKWQKNGVRTAVMALCIGISMVGASDLDKFVALIGSFACVPLVYIYPAYLHYRGAAETTREKVLDIVLMTAGLIAMVFTTAITVFQWIDSKV